MESFEDIAYRIMELLSNSKLPLVFKGALVLKAARDNSSIDRLTYDIDCDWIGDPPSTKEIENLFNSIMLMAKEEIVFETTREYIVGLRSAGFNIYRNNKFFTKMDLSISKVISSNKYYYAQAEFTGYSLENIICDKTLVLSTEKIFRRIKDLVDIYTILLTKNITKEKVLRLAKNKNREFGSFDAFINKKDDLRHAYELLKGVINKPDFDEVYEMVNKYVVGMTNENKNMVWNHKKQKWI